MTRHTHSMFARHKILYLHMIAVSARISSVSIETVAAVGTRVQLACAALGAPPLRRRWAPLPPEHTITDAGDLIIHS